MTVYEKETFLSFFPFNNEKVLTLCVSLAPLFASNEWPQGPGTLMRPMAQVAPQIKPIL